MAENTAFCSNEQLICNVFRIWYFPCCRLFRKPPAAAVNWYEFRG
jgi:hypothetical protein